MSEPFIFIGTHRLKEGKLDAARGMNGWLTDLVASNEPRMIAFNAYANREGTEVSIVQIHPDADSMLFHMQLLSQHITGAYTEEGPLDETTSIQLYGDPGETVLEMIKQYNPGVPLTVKPDALGGFARFATQESPAAS
jgi:hypothetical protein